MNISFDLSSKIENRIDQELFQDDSDDLSLPGMSRRASMTHSTSDVTGLLRSPATNDPVETNPGFQEHMNDVSVSNSTGQTDQVSDELQQLDERLLDESDSLRLSPKHEQVLEISESSHRELCPHPESHEGSLPALNLLVQVECVNHCAIRARDV